MNDNEILDISSIVFVNKEKDLDQERKVLGILFAQQPWCFDCGPGFNPSSIYVIQRKCIVFFHSCLRAIRSRRSSRVGL